MKRARLLALGSLALAGLAAPAAAAATAQQTGTIHLFVQPSGNGRPGPIVVTGAIGDYGTVVNINQNGTVDPTGNSNYALVRLQKGTFRVNLTKVAALANKAPGSANATTCSFWETVTGPIALFDGTGAYANISGTVTITETLGGVGPRLASGKCNQSSSAQPVAFVIQVSGSGTVSWG